MSERNVVIVGLLASSKSLSELCVSRGFLAVQHGKITLKGSISEFETLNTSGKFADFDQIHLKDGQFVMPGFVDCHTHAPQFPNFGLGLDRPLLEWLAKYTFPLEKRYSNLEFATEIYNKVVQRLLTNGTTTACYFGSLHLEGTLQLAKSVIEHRQRAFVGKVSMNIQNDAGYYNDTQKEIQDTESFVKRVLDLKEELVQPIVTPRFALSCDAELMTALAKIAEKYDCRIQSHISENQGEIEYVLQAFPECDNYSDVYDKSYILNEKCIMAHAVHLSADEMRLLAQKGVSIAHCPASNTRLKSGLCPVRTLLRNNINVGLGTDVSGGDNATILDAIRRTMDVSCHLDLMHNTSDAISWSEAFYLATMGGAKALGLGDKIGSLDVGKEFDALLIDVYADGGQIDHYEAQCGEDHATALLQRFVYLGDDRNIRRVYVQGRIVKDIL